MSKKEEIEDLTYLVTSRVLMVIGATMEGTPEELSSAGFLGPILAINDVINFIGKYTQLPEAVAKFRAALQELLLHYEIMPVKDISDSVN